MLIVGLLNKGYLKFEKIKYDSINWNYFKIIKIKDYDGNDKYEKILFSEIFLLYSGTLIKLILSFA